MKVSTVSPVPSTYDISRWIPNGFNIFQNLQMSVLLIQTWSNMGRVAINSYSLFHSYISPVNPEEADQPKTM